MLKRHDPEIRDDLAAHRYGTRVDEPHKIVKELSDIEEASEIVQSEMFLLMHSYFE